MPYQIYLVGGAVRDRLLGHPYHEKDWVVVGATPEIMLKAGYQQVGKDFPVFLHPESGEEYALARAERKIAAGYHGFEVDSTPTITLEEDLLRRDLTINAIAEDRNGKLIDPYNGLEDLKSKKLRHVSDAFAEDPVRVLRLARFYARYSPYGFTIAPETKELVQKMIDAGELEHLVPERVWAEMVKALSEERPEQFFYALKELNALPLLFPEIANLFGVPQTERYHPEIDSGIHTMMALAKSAEITDDLPTRFAVLCHDFGKAITPKEEWPSHKMHEIRGVPIVQYFCERLKAPKEYRDIALKVTELHLLMHQLRSLRPKTLLKLFTKLDAFRRPQYLVKFIDACQADAQGRLGFENSPFPQRHFLLYLYEGLKNLNISELLKSTQRTDIPRVIEEERIKLIKTMIKEYSKN